MSVREGPRCKRCHDPVEAGFFVLGCCVECSYLEQAALDERAAIVRWLRTDDGIDRREAFHIARLIEHGDHLDGLREGGGAPWKDCCPSLYAIPEEDDDDEA